MRRPLALLLVVLALAAGLVAAPAGAAQTAPRTGLLRLVLQTPSGVPANLVIRGGRTPLTVAKPPKGMRFVRGLRLRPGRYRLEVPVVTANGVRYSGHSRGIVLRAGRAASAIFRLRAEGGATRLAATTSRTAVSLHWRASRGITVALRRTTGLTPPATVREGVAVRTSRGTALDRAVRPGTAYAYALFTRRDGRWLGPVTARLRTPARTTASTSYVAAPDTAFVTTAQVQSVRAASGGIAVALSADAPRPVVGAAIVLPPHAGLAGGYIGLVAGFAADGAVLLAPGGLGDALTTYDLSSDGFSSDLTALPLDRVRATLARRSVPLRRFAAAASPVLLHRADAASTGPITCDGAAKPTLTLQRKLTVGGSFHLTGDMSNPARPTARVISSTYLEGQLSLGGQLKAEATCSLELPAVATTVMAGPVPIAVAIDPVVTARISGAVTFGGLGFTFRSGFATSRTLTMTPNGIETGGSETPIKELQQLQPTVSARTDVEVRVGGDLEVGPGVSSSVAGVSAGIHAELDLVKGTVGVAAAATSGGPALCVHFSAGLRAVVGLYARAFLKAGFFSIDLKGDVDLPPFEVPFGHEISAPEGCALERPVVVGAATTTAVGITDSGVSTYTGGGGGGWGDPVSSALPVPASTSAPVRPLGDGATTVLPADAGDRTAVWSTLTGHVATDTTLGADAQHSGWILDGVTVDPGATLTIAAGTRLRIVDRRWYDGSLEPSVRVDGAIDIDGTTAEPVLLAGMNDTRVGGTTGRENPYPDRSPNGASYQAFSGAGDVRIVHAYVADASALGGVSGAMDIRATGFDRGTRLTGVGTSFSLRQIQAAGLQVTAANAAVEDAALTDSTLDLSSGALRDVALTGTSHLQVEGPFVTTTRTSVSATSLPVSGAIGAIGADLSGVTSPDGVPWLAVDGGTVGIDLTATAAMPIAFAGMVTVPAGVTVTVPHGAVLAFTPGNGTYGTEHESVIVAGRLVSSGTGAAPILTARDDAALPVDMSRYHEYGWDGIRVVSGGVVDLTDADLRGRVAVWSGGSLALHGRIATVDPVGTTVEVAANGDARLDHVTGTHLSLGPAVPRYSLGTADSGGNGRIRITDSTLTDSSILMPTADSTIDRTTLSGGDTALGALPGTVNTVGDVRFTDGAADEVAIQPSLDPIGGADLHWTESTVPIRVHGMVSIDSGGSLTLDPGVTLRLGPCRWGYGSTNSCFRLTGTGALHLLGTAAAPVRLLPALVDGDPAQILPWQGIDAEGQSSVELRHVRAALAQQILRSSDTAAVTIDDLQHDQDAGAPLFFNGSSTPATVTGSPGIG